MLDGAVPEEYPERGPAGPAGAPGARGLSGLPRSTKVAASLVLALCLIMSGGALISQQLQQNSFQNTINTGHAQRLAAEAAQAKAQAAQGAAIEAKLCSIFMPISTLKAPAGNAADNPSRLFEQNLEARLALVAPALDCKKSK